MAKRHRITLGQINGIDTIETTRRIWKRVGIDRWEKNLPGPFLLFEPDVPPMAWAMLTELAGEGQLPVPKPTPKPIPQPSSIVSPSAAREFVQASLF
jgi:hypothetical protein